MGEDNGIKIKTNISYPIMSLFIVGLLAYFEVYGIKRIIVDVKNDNVTDILDSNNPFSVSFFCI